MMILPGGPFRKRQETPSVVSGTIRPRDPAKRGRIPGRDYFSKAGKRETKVRVICYEGYRAQETPRAFLLGDRRIEVASVLDRWRGEDHEYVKLDASDGCRYILRYDRARDEWEIHMMESGEPRGRRRP